MATRVQRVGSAGRDSPAWCVSQAHHAGSYNGQMHLRRAGLATPGTNKQRTNNMKNELTTPGSSKRSLKDYLLSPSAIAALDGVTNNLMTGDRLANVLWTCVQRTPALMECEPATLVTACKTLALMGCEPDGIHGYLVPYKNKKAGTTTVTPIPSARGLMRMARLCGTVQGITLGVVYAEDEFDWGVSFGTFSVTHKSAWNHEGAPLGYYVLWRDNHGNLLGERMSREEVEKIRDRSNAWKAYKQYGKECPWNTDPEQMALKTVIKRAAKRWDFPLEAQQAMQDADEAEFGSKMRDVTPEKPSITRPSFLLADADVDASAPATEDATEPQPQQ